MPRACSSINGCNCYLLSKYRLRCNCVVYPHIPTPGTSEGVWQWLVSGQLIATAPSSCEGSYVSMVKNKNIRLKVTWHASTTAGPSNGAIGALWGTAAQTKMSQSITIGWSSKFHFLWKLVSFKLNKRMSETYISMWQCLWHVKHEKTGFWKKLNIIIQQ